jgi:hypothetical protein
MVEEPSIPAVRVVATGTLGTESALMDIDSRVAAPAGCLGPSIASAHVAVLARGQLVERKQGKVGELMVEADSSGEARLRVTGRTISTETPLVDVDAGMAINAGRWGRLLVHLLHVAQVARHLGVRSPKRQLRIPEMVEA